MSAGPEPPWCTRRVLGVLLWAFATVVGPATAGMEAELEIFVRDGCPRCAAAERFLEEVRTTRPGLRLVVRHVDADRDARRRLEDLSRRAAVEVPGVPSFYVRGHLVVGWIDATSTGAQIRGLLEGAPLASAGGGICTAAPEAPCGVLTTGDAVATPWGTLRLAPLGLPFFTVVLGLLDGFNPCAMWVLLFLLSMLVNLHDRRTMALIAATFVLVSGVFYFAFMAAWLNVFLVLGWSRPVQLVLGAIALVVGLVNVKEFVAFGQGPSLSIPARAKPGIYARVRALLRAERLGAALVGTVVLAGLVNVVELLCTAGLPAVYTAILARQSLTTEAHYGYLVLYNLAYVADDALMVAVAVATLSRRKLQEGAGRWLKLVSGVVMLLLATALLLVPDVLELGGR